MTPADELVRTYRLLRRNALNDSHSGNASVRHRFGIWVTPTGACADTLRPEQLVACQPGREPPPGATLDARLHLEVYARNPGTGAVLHAHNPHTTALTLDGRDFRPVDFEGAYYFDRVPVLDIPYAEYVERSPAAVAGALGDHKVVVVRGHGVYARGPDLNLAYKWVASVEQSARIAWLARMAGTAPAD